jgi:hypothetical protein
MAVMYSLSGGEGDDLLVLGRPGDGTAINEKCVARYGSPVLGHGAISSRIAFKDVPCLAVQQEEVAHAGQVAEDLLDGLLMHGPGVCTKMRHHRNSECDIWACGECGPVEHTDGLMVWYVTHRGELRGGGRCLL